MNRIKELIKRGKTFAIGVKDGMYFIIAYDKDIDSLSNNVTRSVYENVSTVDLNRRELCFFEKNKDKFKRVILENDAGIVYELKDKSFKEDFDKNINNFKKYNTTIDEFFNL